MNIKSMVQEWRRNSEPQMSMVPEKGANVLTMEVVEDFMYLNCSSSANSLQVHNNNFFFFVFSHFRTTTFFFQLGKQFCLYLFSQEDLVERNTTESGENISRE